MNTMRQHSRPLTRARDFCEAWHDAVDLEDGAEVPFSIAQVAEVLEIDYGQAWSAVTNAVEIGWIVRHDGWAWPREFTLSPAMGWKP